MCRPFIQDYVADRKGARVHEMATSSMAGDHIKTTVGAAQYDLLDTLLEDMEAYYAQESAIHGFPPMW